MEPYELNPARIVGECYQCGHLYNICSNGFVCDACGYTGQPRGARFVDRQETSIAAAERAAAMAWEEVQRHRSKYHGRLGSPYAHTEGDLKDIAELNHIFSLTDERV
jgi:hypothetical protein